MDWSPGDNVNPNEGINGVEVRGGSGSMAWGLGATRTCSGWTIAAVLKLRTTGVIKPHTGPLKARL